MIYHTLDAFSGLSSVTSRVITLSPANLKQWHDQTAPLTREWTAVAGGSCREDSVRLGMGSLTDPKPADLVIVHDGVRPCLRREDLRNTIRKAGVWGAAICVAPVRDTLKRVDGDIVTATADRGGLYHALTPQVARYGMLKQAFDAASDQLDRFTDESGLLESAGLEVKVVTARHPNPKLTYPEDLAVIRSILGERETS